MTWAILGLAAHPQLPSADRRRPSPLLAFCIRFPGNSPCGPN